MRRNATRRGRKNFSFRRVVLNARETNKSLDATRIRHWHRSAAHMKIFVPESIANCAVELFHMRVIIAVPPAFSRRVTGRKAYYTESSVAIKFFVNAQVTNLITLQVN